MTHELIGKKLNVSIQPYEFGTAEVISVFPSHEWNKPERLVEGYTTLIIRAIEMYRVSRLMGHSSKRAIPEGEEFRLDFYNGRLPRILETLSADYVCSV